MAAPVQVPTYRAEVPLFAVLPEQLRQGNLAMLGSLHQRIGDDFALGEGWQIQPQAQLVHQRLDLDDVDIAGARVRQERDSTWLARVGVRVKGDIATRAGRLQPYARVNLYRASGGSDTTRFFNLAASTAIASSRGGTSTELAAGFTLGLSESTSLYGDVGKLWASGGDTRVKGSLSGSVGLKVRW